MMMFFLLGMETMKIKQMLKEIGVFILILAIVLFMSSIDSIIDLLLYK